MQLHHTKHHQAYIDKLNLVLSKYPSHQSDPIETLLMSMDKLAMDEKDKIILRNNGGGHLNHAFFWTIMAPKKSIDDTLKEKIMKNYQTLENFRKEFATSALNHFGSGWMWLVENEKKELEMYSTPNQDSPYLFHHTPLLGLDLWEHAYYLTYQNRKTDYINNWWNVVKIL